MRALQRQRCPGNGAGPASTSPRAEQGRARLRGLLTTENRWPPRSPERSADPTAGAQPPRPRHATAAARRLCVCAGYSAPRRSLQRARGRCAAAPSVFSPRSPSSRLRAAPLVGGAVPARGARPTRGAGAAAAMGKKHKKHKSDKHPYEGGWASGQGAGGGEGPRAGAGPRPSQPPAPPRGQSGPAGPTRRCRLKTSGCS